MNKQLGAVFAAKEINKATMTELQEARAKAGFCPLCQAKALKRVHTEHDMEFQHCEECGSVVVLHAP